MQTWITRGFTAGRAGSDASLRCVDPKVAKGKFRLRKIAGKIETRDV